MPPAHSLSTRGASSQTPATFAALAAQWRNPNDILAILTVIGGDVVRGALAQASSHPNAFAPVALSFGWVAYSFSAIVAAIGPRRLAPDPDCSCTLVDVHTGYSREVKSWILSRLVRDFELPDGTPGGLTILFYHTSPDKPTGVPDRDWVYYIGPITIALQIGIAVIPGALVGNWAILILTFGGVLLAQLQASLPQWREELWHARPIKKGKREVVCLSQGNGSAFVIVITSDGCGLRLSDLAAGREIRSKTTVPATFSLALLWLIHLFCICAVKSNTWYLLLIGGLGMLQNALAFGARRDPGALGFHLKKVDQRFDSKVFRALQEAEEVEKKVGVVLTDMFFPGGLRPDEEQWRNDRIEQYKRADLEKKAGRSFTEDTLSTSHSVSGR